MIIAFGGYTRDAQQELPMGTTTVFTGKGSQQALLAPCARTNTVPNSTGVKPVLMTARGQRVQAAARPAPVDDHDDEKKAGQADGYGTVAGDDKY